MKAGIIFFAIWITVMLLWGAVGIGDSNSNQEACDFMQNGQWSVNC